MLPPLPTLTEGSGSSEAPLGSGCGWDQPAGQVGQRQNPLEGMTEQRLEVLICDFMSRFIIMRLVRSLQAQPISCFMSFVYGFGLILSEKQESAFFFFEIPFCGFRCVSNHQGALHMWKTVLVAHNNRQKRLKCLFHVDISTHTPPLVVSVSRSCDECWRCGWWFSADPPTPPLQSLKA